MKAKTGPGNGHQDFNRMGVFLILLSIAVVFLMFSTRLVTLNFGQVFPTEPPETKKEIAELRESVSQLTGAVESLRQDTTSKQTEIETLKEQNRTLAEAAESAKNAPPVIVYKQAPPKVIKVVAPQPTESSEEAATNSGTVHRGDAMAKVRRVFGKPPTVQTVNDEEWWIYNYAPFERVVFRGRVVSEWDGLPIEP